MVARRRLVSRATPSATAPHRTAAASSSPQRADVCLIGNHDLVALGKLDVDDFNEEAAAAALWTRDELEERWRSFLSALEPKRGRRTGPSSSTPVRATRSGSTCSAPRRPTSACWRRRRRSCSWDTATSRSRSVSTTRTCTAGLAPAGTEIELDGRWLINPGLGRAAARRRPARRLARARHVERFARFRRVAYPIERTQAEMRERGLPESLVTRLVHGI